MIYLRSLSFYILYLLSGLLAGLAGCLIGPFLNISNRIKFLSAWPRFANWVLYKSCKIEVVVEGSENIPSAPFVIASNHQGQWETLFYQYIIDELLEELEYSLI